MKSAWPRKPFGELAEFRNGLNFSSSAIGMSIKLLGVAEFGDRFRLNPTALPYVAIGQEVESSQLLRDGDI